MTGLTLRELCAALADTLATYAPVPPPEHLRDLIDAVDAVAPDGDLEPSLGWSRSMALGDQSDLEADC